MIVRLFWLYTVLLVLATMRPWKSTDFKLQNNIKHLMEQTKFKLTPRNLISELIIGIL